jgi:alpha-beta hydrolase superfamily lysophospholipase
VPDQANRRLIPVAVPAQPAGVVLVLHGGASRGRGADVRATQLSVLRMIPVAARVARRGHGRLAVFRLLNSRRGWDPAHTPVADAHWALDQIAERLAGSLPSCLIGHSLGGRAAILAATRREVSSVCALAPWVYPDDLPEGLRARRILIVHGTQDRVASPQRSAALARRLAEQAGVGYVSVPGGRHAMLRHRERFEGLAAEFAACTLLETSDCETVSRVPSERSFVLL